MSQSDHTEPGEGINAEEVAEESTSQKRQPGQLSCSPAESSPATVVAPSDAAADEPPRYRPKPINRGHLEAAELAPPASCASAFDRKQARINDAVTDWLLQPAHLRKLHIVMLRGIAATNSATVLGRTAGADADLLEALEAAVAVPELRERCWPSFGHPCGHCDECRGRR